MRVGVVLTTLKANVGNNEIALPVIIHSSKNLPKKYERQGRLFFFLGPRGPLVLPSVGPSPSVRPSRTKNLDHLFTGIYAS